MNCPNCNTKMEREDTCEIVGEKRVSPTAYYTCEDCGFEALWTLQGGPRGKFEVIWDPRKEGTESAEKIVYLIRDEFG